MGGEPHPAKAVPGDAVEHGQGAGPEAHVDAPGGLIHAYVVGVLPQPDRPQEGERRTVENAAGAVTAVGDHQTGRRGKERDALGLVESGQAARPAAGAKIDDLDRVVPERGQEEPLPRGVQGHVIEAALDPRERDGLEQAQGLSTAGGREPGRTGQDAERGDDRPRAARDHVPGTAPTTCLVSSALRASENTRISPRLSWGSSLRSTWSLKRFSSSEKRRASCSTKYSATSGATLTVMRRSPPIATTRRIARSSLTSMVSRLRCLPSPAQCGQF